MYNLASGGTGVGVSGIAPVTKQVHTCMQDERHILLIMLLMLLYEEEEEAFLDELDYREMVLDVDEALDDLRLEAAGCSGGDRAPTTGFLGRYDFFTLQDFLKLVD